MRTTRTLAARPDLRPVVIATLPFTTSHAEWLGLLVGVVSLIGIGGIVSTLICNKSGGYRRGRFRHGHYRLCHIHHPNVPSDGKITVEHIAAVKPPGEAARTSESVAAGTGIT
jgi:hypothetical protein